MNIADMVYKETGDFVTIRHTMSAIGTIKLPSGVGSETRIRLIYFHENWHEILSHVFTRERNPEKTARHFSFVWEEIGWEEVLIAVQSIAANPLPFTAAKSVGE